MLLLLVLVVLIGHLSACATCMFVQHVSIQHEHPLLTPSYAGGDLLSAAMQQLLQISKQMARDAER